jgi:hypothetical protein
MPGFKNPVSGVWGDYTDYSQSGSGNGGTPSYNPNNSVGQVGIRQLFENQGKKVDYDAKTGNIIVSDPRTGEAKLISAGSYTNTDGTAKMDFGVANNLFKSPYTQNMPTYGDFQNWQATQQQSLQSDLRTEAMRQAKEIAKQKENALNSLIAQLKTGQEVGLKNIQTGLEDAKQGVEDNSFQKWLTARQAMANRGLAGSGLASDQDTRLLLAKQRDLAGVYRDAENQSFQLSNQYGNSLNDAYTKLSDVNTGEISSDIFQKLYSEGAKGLNDQATNYLKWMEMYYPSGKDLLSAQESNYQYNNVSGKDQAAINADWAKWNTPSGNAILDNKTKVDMNTLDNQVMLAMNQLDNQTRIQVEQMSNNAKLQAAQIASSRQALSSSARSTAQKLQGSLVGDAYTRITDKAYDADQSLKMLMQESPNIISRFGMKGFQEMIDINTTQQALEKATGKTMSGGNFSSADWRDVEDANWGADISANAATMNPSANSSSSDSVDDSWWVDTVQDTLW